MTDRTPTLGILGAGNMAEALVRGLLTSEVLPVSEIVAFDPAEERQAVFRGMGVRMADASSEVACAETVLVAVKPQIFTAVVREACRNMTGEQRLVSIAAGMPAPRIASLVPDGVRIVRVMPNTPMLVGHGMSGIAAGPNATDDDLEWVRTWFAAAGQAEIVDENLMNAVTAVSGSGPAYLFRFVEVLAGAAVQVGLSTDQAERFARQTVIGAAHLLAQESASVRELRERVTSPGGTTAAALQSMEQDDLEALVRKAVTAARDRGAELGREQ